MTTEQAVKDLKIKRRTAKAKLTRMSNALQHLLDHDRDLEEVDEAFQGLQVTFIDLEKRHEAFCETIDDEDEFIKEEIWLESCQSTFINMQMRIRDHAKSKAIVTVPDESDGPSGATAASSAAAETAGQENETVSREAEVDSRVVTSCKVQMERPKLPKFSGDVREFATFRSDFHHLIDTRYSKRDAVTILRTCLQGKPLDMIRGVGNDYDAAWAYLNSVFGDRRFIADAIIYDVNSFRDLRDGDDSRFCDLVHLLRRSFNTLKEVGCPQDIDNSQTLALIERKLTLEDRKVWFRHLDSADKDVSLQHLLDWMETEMKTRMRATAPLRSATSSSKQKNTVHHVSAEDSKQRNESNQYTQYKCWICESSEHWVDHCKKVLSKSQTERFQLMRDNHACFSCLKKAGREHNMRTCKRRKRCSKEINGEQCSSFHHPLLHREVQTRREIVASVAGKSALLPVVMVKVLGPDQKSSTANCLIDSGSQISLVKQSMAEDMGLVGKPITINITKVGGHVEEVQTKLYRMRLQSLEGKQAYGVSALGLECINDNVAEVQVDELARKFDLKKHLLHRGFGSIDVLVGTDHAKMHRGETREKGNMLARHSPLGWVVFGATSEQQPTKSTVLNVMLANPVDLKDFWTTESMGVCHDPEQCQPNGLSKQEAEECKLISDSCQKVGKQWLVPYPWRKDPNLLRDNRIQAERMLYATEKKLSKNAQHAEAYDHQIKAMVEMNFAKKLSDEEAESYIGPVHYISHHAIVRPEKKSTPVRIVFNSSAVYQGQSLNDHWMKGPDLLNSLFGVLLRFREHDVALCADISKMYHRVMIPESDQHVHRFLWRNLSRHQKPDVYVMKVVTFGDKPAPAMAQMALRKTAEEGAVKYPRAASAINHNTYMDDVCISVPTMSEAEELSRDVDTILADGGFNVKEWRSNKPLSRHTDETEQTGPKLLETISDEKVLGVVWEDDSDVFSYKVKLNENVTHTNSMTKRRILSQVARIFDPIGYAAAFVVRAKIGLQRLWEEGLDWDAELSESCQSEWRKFFEEMEKLNNVKLERCLTPSNAVGKPTLCIFCDASMKAFGACAYLRWGTDEGNFEVRFLTAKSRVAPLKQLTIPRLELQAAVLASRLYRTISTEMTMELEEVIFMTDSMIALSWVKSKAKSFKVFVSTRVGEIQGSTDPSQWRHIPGEVNVADDLTRGLNADQLNGRWQHGPDFLCQPKSKWPEEPKVEGKVPEVESERRREQSVLIVTHTDEDVIDYKRFSSWRKLIRVTSNVLKFVRRLRSKCRKEIDDSDNNTSSTLTPDELEQGEAFLIQNAQKSLKGRIEKGELKALSAYTDSTGIIRVGGRVDRAEMSFERKHPALLPFEHWISTLITRHVHKSGHTGVAATTAKARRRYWILKGHRLAKTVKFRCTVCRAFDHKAESQEMAELPRERLAPHTPPFHYTACDYFGPFAVRFGRNKTTKHYGVLFTCLNTRAVHLELATDCSTMEFVQVLRRFFALRGQPSQIWSDNGTQFVGAQSEIKEFCTEKGTKWTFITPAAPHHNGCAESLVKSCKYALKRAIGEQILTPFELYTCLMEVANLVNQRPIGRIPTDPDDGNYLSPNDMLLGRASSDVAQGPFRQTKNPRHRVELVQQIADAFWHRWTRDVLPLLTPRWKWNVDRRNVCVDDIVMMADANALRGKWTIARVVEVYPGPDGRVRNVKVKTSTSEYRRPITKIAIIYPAEGYEE